MRRTPLYFSALIVAALSLGACSTPQVSPTPAQQFPTRDVRTLEAQATRQAAATLTAMPTDTPLPTRTPTPTQTLTPTIAPVIVTIDSDAYCRSGPGIMYPVTAYLYKGDQSQAVGREVTSSYWVIQEPKQPDKTCWVISTVTSISGDPLHADRLPAPSRCRDSPSPPRNPQVSITRPFE